MHKIVLAGVVLLGIFSCGSYADVQRTAKLTLKNTTDIDRPEATLVLSKNQLEAKTGPLGDKYLTFQNGRKRLMAQYVDLDGDNKWDEVILRCPIKAQETVAVQLVKTDKKSVVSHTDLAHARMKLKNEDQTFGGNQQQVQMPDQNPPTDFSRQALPPYLTEGPGWENDKVAFRLYFDTRNNKDIYGKRTADMVMDSVGANPKNSYHKLAGWGMDILKVGSSLGAGALAFHYQKADGKDTLVRLGGKDIKGETYQLLEDGPLRASFLMTYPWQLAGKPVTVTEKISICAGDYYYTSVVAVEGAGVPNDLRVDMGIADFYSNQMDSVVTDHAKAVYSFGKQSENHDNLGMAVISLDPGATRIWNIQEKSPLTDITSTYMLESPISKDHPVTFRFYAGWSLSDPAFNTASGFKNKLQEAIMILNHPISVE